MHKIDKEDVSLSHILYKNFFHIFEYQQIPILEYQQIPSDNIT